MVISSVIIVFVAVYLLIKVMNENPVVGEWMDDDGNYAVNILNNGKLYVTDYTEGEETEELELLYKIDKENRMIAISSDEKVLEDAMEASESEHAVDYAIPFKSEHAVDARETELNDQTVIFNYSVDNDQLILTEREYGDQMILIKE